MSNTISRNGQLGIFKSLKILFGYRSRVIEGVMHDIRQRYVGSIFGVLWAVLYPLLQLSIYATLYALVFKVRASGLTETGYVVLVFSGLICLLAFSEILSATTSSLSANKSLLLNTVFPAELIPLRAALSAQVTSMFGLLITLFIGLLWGGLNFYTFLLVPFFWVLLLMFSVGIGWILSLFSLIARDIQYGLGLITMLLFILSPFAYTPEMVPQVLRPMIYLNPLSYFVLTFQSLICYGTMPSPIIAGMAIFLGIGSFLFGFKIFQKSKHIFFDYA